MKSQSTMYTQRGWPTHVYALLGTPIIGLDDGLPPIGANALTDSLEAMFSENVVEILQLKWIKNAKFSKVWKPQDWML